MVYSQLVNIVMKSALLSHLYEFYLSILENWNKFNLLHTKSIWTTSLEPFYFEKLMLSKKDDKDQETIQSRTTPDPGYHMAK